MKDLILTELAPPRPSVRATPTAAAVSRGINPFAVHSSEDVTRRLADRPRDASTTKPGAESSADAWTLCLSEREIEYLQVALQSLTERERQVVIAICGGGTNDELAERMCIAVPTVRTHLMRLNQKFGTTSKGDVIRYVAAALLCGYRSGGIAVETSAEHAR